MTTMAASKIHLESYADAEFQQALIDIESGGNAIKHGFQIAVRRSIQAILYRQDTRKIDMLDRKLETLESSYYKKLLRKNLATFCGYVDIELDSKGQLKYYYKDEKTSPIVYSKAKGEKGWKIKSDLSACKKTYEQYFTKVKFAGLKISERESKKSFVEVMENHAKEILDIATIASAAMDDPVWDKIKPEYKAILEVVAKLKKD